MDLILCKSLLCITPSEAKRNWGLNNDGRIRTLEEFTYINMTFIIVWSTPPEFFLGSFCFTPSSALHYTGGYAHEHLRCFIQNFIYLGIKTDTHLNKLHLTVCLCFFKIYLFQPDYYNII